MQQVLQKDDGVLAAAFHPLTPAHPGPVSTSASLQPLWPELVGADGVADAR